MRFVIIIAALLCATLCWAQDDKATEVSTMKFENTSWNFGRVKEVDGEISHTFTFVNAGKKPFVIENVAVSCGCTRPKFSRAPILPGAKGTIEITFDPAGRPGAFIKHITVVSDNRRNVNQLEISGEVIGKPLAPEDEYPYEVGNSPVRLSQSHLNMGYVVDGESKSMVVGFYNNSDREVVMQVRSGLPSSESTTTYKIAPRTRGDMTLTCDLRNKNLKGMQSADVEFYVDGELRARKFQVTYIGVDDMRAMDKTTAPKVVMDRSYYNFGDVKHGKSVSVEFEIKNDGKSPLRISSCQTNQYTECSLKAGDVVAAGQSRRFTVTLNTSHCNKGRLFSNIYMTMNDPMRPFRELRLVANVQ